MHQFFDEYFEKIERLPELLLFGLILAATLFLIYEAWDYRSSARLLPMITLVALAVLLVIRLLTIHFDNLGERIFWMIPSASGEESAEDEDGELGSLESLQATSGGEQHASTAWRGIAWVIAFTIVLYIFGLLISIPFLLLAFMLIEYRGHVKTSIIVTIVLSGLIYLLFDVILNVRLYHGVIPIAEMIGLV